MPVACSQANRDAPDEGGAYVPPTLAAFAGADRQFVEPNKSSNPDQMSLEAAIGARSALDHRRSDSGTSIDIKHRPEALRSDVFSVDLLEGNKHLNVDDWVKLSRLESLDYHTCHNELYKKEMERLKDWNYSVDSLQRWIIALMIGIVTGLIAFGIHLSIELIQENKFTLKQYMVTNYGVWVTWIMMFVFNLSIVLPGTLLVLFFSNAANSSGIPFVKSYQNGVKIPQAFNLKTLATKIIGCVSAVSSNMPVGPEGLCWIFILSTVCVSFQHLYCLPFACQDP